MMTVASPCSKRDWGEHEQLHARVNIHAGQCQLCTGFPEVLPGHLIVHEHGNVNVARVVLLGHARCDRVMPAVRVPGSVSVLPAVLRLWAYFKPSTSCMS
jgi:hypothetical protein